MRIKRGINKNRRHKKVLEQAKGYRMSYNRLYRRAVQVLLHSGEYSFAHRKKRRSQKKTEWIKIISAGLVESGLSYSKFKSGLTKNNIEIDSKNLAEMVTENPKHFSNIVEMVK